MVSQVQYGAKRWCKVWFLRNPDIPGGAPGATGGEAGRSAREESGKTLRAREALPCQVTGVFGPWGGGRDQGNPRHTSICCALCGPGG